MRNHMGTQMGADAKTSRDPLLLIHAGVVLGLILLLALLVRTHDGDVPDANIGAGLVGLNLGILGVPWSLAYFALDFVSNTDDPTPGVVLVCLAAALNVLIHGVVRARHGRCARPSR